MDGIVIIYLFIFALGAYHFLPAGGLGGGSSSLSGTNKNMKSYLSPEKTIRDRHPTSMKSSKDPPPPLPQTHLTYYQIQSFSSKCSKRKTLSLRPPNTETKI